MGEGVEVMLQLLLQSGIHIFVTYGASRKFGKKVINCS